MNGQVTTVIDGNGNRAQLRYDGHLRQDRWTFPSSTPPANRPVPYNDADQATALATAGAVNADDYEEYGYDDAGNRLTLRKRDGSLLGYTYDNLNRLVLKTVPERTSGSQALTAAQTRDVHYGYDLRNNPLFARFDSPTGEGVTNGYDAFGRQVSQSINLGGITRTLGYALREDGPRTRLTHPDGTYFSYEYDQAGRLNFIRENGTASTPVTIGYAPDGVPGAIVRSNGAITAFGYDTILRPSLLLHDLTGSAGDVTWTYTRNPASGLASQTRNNDAYAWTSHYPANRAYLTNGLNQYTLSGTFPFGYDLNGNLSTTPAGSSGSLTYVYDIENRLVGRTGTGAIPALSLVYDPLGRLFSFGVGGGATTTFLWDGDALVAEYDGAILLRRYAHLVGADVPAIWYEGATLGDPRHLFADHQGSIVARDNMGGTATLSTYDEYGIPGEGSSDRFRYTGQIWLRELGMYHYKARIYSPSMGRFLQTDPVGYDDQHNFYAYVGNDPVNLTDPSGTVRCSNNSQCETVHEAAAEARTIAQRGAADLRNLAQAVDNGTELNAAQTSLLGAVERKFGSASASTLNNVAGRLERIANGIGERGTGILIRFGRRKQGEMASARVGGNSMILRPEFFETRGSRSLVILHEAGHGSGRLHDVALPRGAPPGIGATVDGVRRAYGAPAANWLGQNSPSEAARNTDNYVCLVHSACGN